MQRPLSIGKGVGRRRISSSGWLANEKDKVRVPSPRPAEMAPVRTALPRLENLLRMGILWVLAAVFSYMKLLFDGARRSPAVGSFPRTSSPDLAHARAPACIVTGASSGIGKATAEALALYGYHVILAGRSTDRCMEVMRELKTNNMGISFEVLELDLCSLDSISAFKNAVELSLKNRQLKLLVNNAGILACSQRRSADGFDSMMASNYLGPYFLTQQLLPLLRKGPHARIVNVVSFTHRCVRAFRVDEKDLAEGTLQTPEWKGNWYKVAQVYEASKLCLVLFTYELHRRLSTTLDSSTISVLAADPGIVQTNIMHELPGWLEGLTNAILRLLRLLQCPQIGARAVIDAALAPEMPSERTGSRSVAQFYVQ